MSGRRRKILLRLAAPLAVLGLVTALGVWFLVGTEVGARWLFTRVGAAMAGSLSVEKLEGPLRGPLVARGLVYESEGFEVRVERLALDWRLSALLARRLDIGNLEAEGVKVVLATSDERGEEPAALPDVHLPIAIIVRGARVRGVEIVEPGAEPIRIDSIDLVTRAAGRVVDVERLAVRSPEISADVAGRVEPRGDYAVDLALEWSAALPGQPRWAGGGTLRGSLEELRVEHRLTAPLAARVEATLFRPLRDLAFDGVVEAEPFDLALLDPTLPAARVGGRVAARGKTEELSAEADLDAEVADVGPLAAALAFERRGDRWRIARLVATSPAAPAARLEAEGEVTIPSEGSPRFDLRGTWRSLRWPLAGPAELASAEGRGSIEGEPEAYGLELAGLFLTPDLAALGLPPTPVALAGRGDEEGLALERGRAELLGGTLTARGQVSWSPQVEWRLALAGEGLDPASLVPDARGDLRLTGATAGRLEEAGPYGSIRPLRVSGTLRGEPLEAGGAFELAGERVALSGLEAKWGTLRLAGRGRLAPTLDFAFDLAAPNLGVALKGAAGAVTARGRLSGPPEAPRLEATAAGEGLVWGELSAATLRAEADLSLAPGAALALDVEATRVAAGERSWERVAVEGAGRREAHRLAVVAEAAEGGLRLAAVGGLDAADVWRGEVVTLDLQVPQAGTWSLARPAALSASATAIEIESLCEVSGAARLCAQGEWRSGRGWRAAADLDALPLSLAAALLPPDLAISGAVEGRIEAQADARGALTASAALRPGPGEVVYPLPDGGTETLRFGRGEVRATAGARGVEAEVELPLPDLGGATAELTLPGYRLAGPPGEGQPLAGRLQAEVTDLSFLQAFSQEIDDTAGRLRADLRLAGTVGRPRIRGEARLEEGRVAVPQLGIRLTDLSFAAADRGGDVLILTGSARSGEGTLTLEGEAPAVPGAERPIRLAIRGRRFTAMDTPEVELLASPDLELTYDGERLALSGDVVVPEAEIEIEKAPAGMVTASRDVVYVGTDRRAAAAGGLPLAMRVRVILGREVEVDALGLKAKPTGSLLLIEEPGRPSAAVGEIDLAGGTFEAYGQDLTIERGRLAFAGPVDNPRVDLRAFRRARDGVVAGLEARGTLGAPEITLWSQPPMDQSNQLSYILLGRPIGQAAPAEGGMLANAAVSLGLKGGNLLAEKLAARFGLEEARVETEGGIEHASLVLGKYLSPRLYVAFGVGLFEAVNTLRIRYLLSSRWTLEATTGAGTAADLLYTIERGRGAPREVPEDRAPLVPREAPAAGASGGPPG